MLPVLILLILILIYEIYYIKTVFDFQTRPEPVLVPEPQLVLDPKPDQTKPEPEPREPQYTKEPVPEREKEKENIEKIKKSILRIKSQFTPTPVLTLDPKLTPVVNTKLINTTQAATPVTVNTKLINTPVLTPVLYTKPKRPSLFGFSEKFKVAEPSSMEYIPQNMSPGEFNTINKWDYPGYLNL